MRRGERGFTLVEMLVGLLLLGMLGTIVLSAAQVGLRGWTRAERQVDSVSEMEAAQTLLRRAIRHAYPVFASPDARDARILFEGGPSSLGFVGPLPGTPPDTAWAPMRLHLAGRSLMLDWRAELARADTPVRSDRLLGDVARLEIAYLGPPPQGGPAVWQGQWSGRTEMPALVRVRVGRGTSSPVSWPELIVAPRVTANAQCAYDVRDMTCRRTP